MKSAYEDILAIHMDNMKIRYIREHKFSTDRKWRFDFVLLPIEYKFAIEIEGAVWSGGRHTRGDGYTKDLEKYNTATLAGWKVLRYTSNQVKTLHAIENILFIHKSILTKQNNSDIMIPY